MFIVTWTDNGRQLWERAVSRAMAEVMANRKNGTVAYVAL